jgi:hypothetical protein
MVRLWSRIRCRAELAAAHVRVPAEVRAAAPLEQGERILAFTHNPDDALVLVTDRALRHQTGTRWCRIGWEQISPISWDDERHTLAVTVADSGRVAHIRLHTADRARFTDFARERLAYTVLLGTVVPLTGHNYARVTGRRQPGTDRILWQVSLSNGTNAADASVRSAIAAAIAQLRIHVEV